jgi:hypothetical protein
MQLTSPDRLNLRIWLMLTIVGAVLCLIGWFYALM